MLHYLHIENYVLIDSLDIEFPEGLIIITGQTGAGKSILLGALSLLTGTKADATVIADGADSLVVEAEFDVEDTDGQIQKLLDSSDIEFDKGKLLIRRVVHRSGRSRSFINDSPVSASTLGELSSYIIDIHSQHQNLLLNRGNFQLSLLDHFAGTDSLCSRCSYLYSQMRSLEKNIDSFRTTLKASQAESEFNRAQLDQLEKAHLRSGEYEELEQEQKELASAEEIKSFLAEASILNETASNIKTAQKALEKVSRYWEGAKELAERAESTRLEIEDIAYEVDSKNSSLSVSADRLEEVEDRLSVLHTLMRKHDRHSVEALIELKNTLEATLHSDQESEEKLEEMEGQLKKVVDEYNECARELHEKRAESATKLSEELQKKIRSLELDKAVFLVSLDHCEPKETGIDECVFKFDSNGRVPSELSKCASGGEMSRIMLCIKEMMSRYSGMPTLIFDEIDTGVSGSVAHKMGKMICDMGKNMQVFAITHLPQVAAKGDAHYLVSKKDENGRTISTLKRLAPEERINEIARLLSGEHITKEAIANAKSLLNPCH